MVASLFLSAAKGFIDVEKSVSMIRLAGVAWISSLANGVTGSGTSGMVKVADASLETEKSAACDSLARGVSGIGISATVKLAICSVGWTLALKSTSVSVAKLAVCASFGVGVIGLLNL